MANDTRSIESDRDGVARPGSEHSLEALGHARQKFEESIFKDEEELALIAHRLFQNQERLQAVDQQIEAKIRGFSLESEPVIPAFPTAAHDQAPLVSQEPYSPSM
jgi:hypothetical protein